MRSPCIRHPGSVPRMNVVAGVGDPGCIGTGRRPHLQTNQLQNQLGSLSDFFSTSP